MKTKLFCLALAFMGLTFTACSDDDDDVTTSNVPAVCQQAFAARYPDAKSPKWEKEGNYFTAEWTQNTGSGELTAWFKPGVQASESWSMTETDYGVNLFLIPAELNITFNQTSYPSNYLDDITLYEYPDASRNVYAFEVDLPDAVADSLVLFNTVDYKYIKTIREPATITPDTVL